MENKFSEVETALKEAIMTGEYKINEKLPTETELMNKFNSTRYSIRKAMTVLEQKHFIYKIQGRGMFVQDWHKDWTNENSTENKVIGIITTHIADYIFPNIISGIDRVISDKGYSLVISNTHNNYEKERKSLINMLDTQVAGLIIEPTKSALENPNLSLYKEIENDNVPSIFINAKYPEFNFPTLKNDDFDAEKRMTEFLFNQGHESILGIFQVDDIQGKDRMGGFMDAYQSRPEIAYKSNVVMYQSDDDKNKIIKKVYSYLGMENKPTAIVCYNDQLAIKLIDFLKNMGVSIPDDISVVGFDDYQMAKYLSPSLTTMNYEKRQMGMDAGQVLLDMIEGKDVQSITYNPKLVKRDSVKKIK